MFERVEPEREWSFVPDSGKRLQRVAGDDDWAIGEPDLVDLQLERFGPRCPLWIYDERRDGDDDRQVRVHFVHCVGDSNCEERGLERKLGFCSDSGIATPCAWLLRRANVIRSVVRGLGEEGRGD